MKIPTEYIVEIGLLRKRGLCAKCHKRMNIPHHNIQLCKKCRESDLSSISEYILGNDVNSKTKRGERMIDYIVFKLKKNGDFSIDCDGWFFTLIHPIILLIAGATSLIILPFSILLLLYKQFTNCTTNEEVDNG